MSAHSVPLHCPYCAGEDLHPHGERHGAWECRECLRAFSVSLIGQLAPNRPLGTPVPTGSGIATATTTPEGPR
jgi:transposase-like protein